VLEFILMIFMVQQVKSKYHRNWGTWIENKLDLNKILLVVKYKFLINI
jgi:hypothetical protein